MTNDSPFAAGVAKEKVTRRVVGRGNTPGVNGLALSRDQELAIQLVISTERVTAARRDLITAEAQLKQLLNLAEGR